MSRWESATAKATLALIALLGPLAVPAIAGASSNSDNGAAGLSIGCCLLVIVIIIAINIALLVWLMKDAQARGVSAGAWLLVVLIFGVFGWLAYLVARPKGRLVPCPECGRPKPIVDQICPHCGRRVV